MKGYMRILSVSAGALALGLLTVTSPALNAQAAGDVQKAVDAAYAKFKDLKEGKNADYIPALAKVNPNLFGIAVVTVDGKVYTAGDVKTEVSIQSISKVFTMAQVIQEQGLDSIAKRIGVDATGARFNSIIAVEGVRTVVGTGAPEMNPLVNPGAISATSMVTGGSSDAVWKKIIGFHNDAAGRQLSVLQDVYKSESDTNQRNQAIGALMLAYGYIKDNWQQAVDLYTRQCSIGVNASDLATMGATLAAGGRNPVTGKQVMDAAKVPGVLAVMATAGLYDDSGKWLYATGLPAKSGVGGGIVAVSPGKFGIAVIVTPARRRWQQREGAAGDHRHLERARRQPVRGEEGQLGIAGPRARSLMSVPHVWRWLSLLALAVSAAAYAQGRTDVVTLANGDRITGEVVQLQRGRLEFKTDDAGTLYLEWDKLVSVVAARVVEVVTSDNRRFVGMLATAAPRSISVRHSARQRVAADAGGDDRHAGRVGLLGAARRRDRCRVQLHPIERHRADEPELGHGLPQARVPRTAYRVAHADADGRRRGSRRSRIDRGLVSEVPLAEVVHRRRGPLRNEREPRARAAVAGGVRLSARGWSTAIARSSRSAPAWCSTTSAAWTSKRRRTSRRCSCSRPRSTRTTGPRRTSTSTCSTTRA